MNKITCSRSKCIFLLIALYLYGHFAPYIYRFIFRTLLSEASCPAVQPMRGLVYFLLAYGVLTAIVGSVSLAAVKYSVNCKIQNGSLAKKNSNAHHVRFYAQLLTAAFLAVVPGCALIYDPFNQLQYMLYIGLPVIMVSLFFASLAADGGQNRIIRLQELLAVTIFCVFFLHFHACIPSLLSAAVTLLTVPLLDAVTGSVSGLLCKVRQLLSEDGSDDEENDLNEFIPF